MNPTGRLPLAAAQRVADEALGLLGPACTRIEVAGSVRRRREWVIRREWEDTRMAVRG